MRIENKEKGDYIKATFIRPDVRREKILDALRSSGKEGINVSPIEGKILKLFAQMVRAEKIVEIGTLFGYSTSWFLDAIGDTGKVWAFEYSQEHHDKASELLKEDIDKGRLEIILGKASEELPKINALGPFDLVFIDADKGGYMDYLKWADKNLRKGGLIIADNTFLAGQVFNSAPIDGNEYAWQVMREFNKTLADHPHYESMVIPTVEGMTLALKTG